MRLAGINGSSCSGVTGRKMLVGGEGGIPRSPLFTVIS